MPSLAILSLALTTQASASCTRALLKSATSAYITAQTSGQPNLLPHISNLSYIENDVHVPITQGLLSQPLTIDLHHSLHDTTTCTTFTELSCATNPHPYVIHTRLFVADDRVTSIQSVISDAGDWLFNATGHLYWSSTETWTPIPEPLRDTRAIIQAAGDLYLDSWGNGSLKAPYGTPCHRIEGGAYTDTRRTGNNTCFMPEFPQPFKITKRDYVIDEVVGGLGIFNDFPFIDMMRPDGTTSTNLFRIEEGRIRYIHEVTICQTRNCGR
ncbi:hypothetical protein M011DRAFT_484228 [Sporormia fimetaria CBS 119925]|uniref:DUF8021 domain-containing protein n=1 Tax=Sporormia fimetaria CBS 119925 TaxID=1340428 RepID=A0A6A6VLG7_9PLEO|nr:hypothetical protein M011DRAFT_484228 [Sporormia fimetaria CBS 119925]